MHRRSIVRRIRRNIRYMSDRLRRGTSTFAVVLRLRTAEKRGNSSFVDEKCDGGVGWGFKMEELGQDDIGRE